MLIGLLSVGFIFLLFVVASLASTAYKEEIQLLVTSSGHWSMFYYVVITAVAIVVAPVSTLPLMPVATMAWGWQIAGALSVLGWVLGSQVAFFLARRYGKKFIQRFVSLESLARFENSLPKENIFWTVVLLRMTVPVDILSYALGLFSNISTRMFFLSTLVGVTPFAFIFSYTGGLSPGLQFIILIEVIFFVGIVYFVRNKFLSKK